MPAVLYVSPHVHKLAKLAATAAGLPLHVYVERRLRFDAGPTEPLDPESVSVLFSTILQVTKETPDQLRARLVSRAILEEFARVCGQEVSGD